MAIQITNKWLIDLPEDFEKRVHEGKLIFWKTGISVVIAVFSLPENTQKLELLNQIQEKLPEDVLEKLVSTKGEIVGLGYTQVMPIEDNKKRFSLTTFTASDSSCLQMAFYLDDSSDLDWAKTVWERLIYHPESDSNAAP